MMLGRYIAHIKMRAAQDNAINIWSWAARRVMVRLGNDIFIFFWRLFFSWLPSLPGRYIRRIVLCVVLRECGRGLAIGEDVHIEYPWRISVGNNVWIGRNSHISGEGGIQIGDDCMLAHSTIIQTAGHAIEPGRLYREAKIIYGPIRIGNNTWCGTRTIILYNTNIGSNVVVAAGAVVTRDIPDNCLVGGVPAKLIRQIEM